MPLWQAPVQGSQRDPQRALTYPATLCCQFSLLQDVLLRALALAFLDPTLPYNSISCTHLGDSQDYSVAASHSIHHPLPLRPSESFFSLPSWALMSLSLSFTVSRKLPNYLGLHPSLNPATLLLVLSSSGSSSHSCPEGGGLMLTLPGLLDHPPKPPTHPLC